MRYLSVFGIVCLICGLLVCASMTVVCAQGEIPVLLDWPHQRGPDQATGVVPAVDWLQGWNGASIAWKANVGVGFSSIAVANGVVLTMGNRNNTDVVTALHARTGAVLWTHEYRCALKPNMYEGGPNAAPTIDGKVVYTPMALT